MTYDTIREQLEPFGVHPPHNKSFERYQKGEEFAEIRARLLFEQEQSQCMDQFWSLVETAEGLDQAIAGTQYLLLNHAFHAAHGGDLDVDEIAKLLRSLSTTQRTLIADAEARARREAREAAARVAEDLRDGRLASDPAAVADALDAALGVRK